MRPGATAFRYRSIAKREARPALPGQGTPVLPGPRSPLHARAASWLGCRPAACCLRFATEHGDSHCMSVGMPFVFLSTSKARQCLMEKSWRGSLVFADVLIVSP